MAINAYARAAVDRVTTPIAAGLARIGATPNWLTVAGMVVTVAGAGLVAWQARLAGAAVIAAGSILDALDGSVARVRGTVSPLGGFLDSVADRVGDVAVFGAVAWLVRDEPVLFAVTLVGLAGAGLTSYIRAKAESLGWQATVGVFERAERLFVLLVGIAFPVVLPVALWVLALGGLVTVGQRVHAVVGQARTR